MAGLAIYLRNLELDRRYAGRNRRSSPGHGWVFRQRPSAWGCPSRSPSSMRSPPRIRSGP
jgi:hypothetical protein